MKKLSLFKTKPKESIQILKIVIQMKKAGLSDQFISLATTMALEYEGTYDLMQLWFESKDPREKIKIIESIEEELDKHYS